MNKKAFTLIELLVVVLIIGILAAVALPQYQKAVMKTRYATLKNIVEAMAQAQQVYHLANGTYSNDFEELDVSLPGGYDTQNSTPDTYIYPWGKCQTYVNDNGNQIVYCYNDMLHMRYQISLTSMARSCWVMGSGEEKDYPLQNEICKAETGLAVRSGRGTLFDEPYVRWSY